MKLSIIFSTFNESQNIFFLNSLKQFNNLSDVEVIVADFMSTDSTKEVCESHGVIFLTTDLNSRAERLNLAAGKASGDILLFHHPRSVIDPRGIQYLLQLEINAVNFWGGFTHRFDHSNFLLSFTSWYSNNVRGKLREILYLDHCIFISKDLFSKVKFPNLDIFEDTVISNSLSKYASPKILKFSSTTSAIRFTKNGVIKQSILNQIMKLAYFANLDHKTMNKIYEFGLNLNSKY